MNSYDTQKPYTASYLIIRKQGKIAFVLRSNTSWMNGYYGLPSGKVENNESFVQAAIREGKEETGLTLKSGQLKHVHTVHRRDGSDWVDVYFEVKDLKAEPINAEPGVHSELAWLDPSELPENVIPAVADALKAIQNKKTYSEFGWQ